MTHENLVLEDLAQENLRELVADELEGAAAGRRCTYVIECSGAHLYINIDPAWPGGPLMPTYTFVPKSPD